MKILPTHLSFQTLLGKSLPLSVTLDLKFQTNCEVNSSPRSSGVAICRVNIE
jgi:hypothetical protein